MKQQIRILGVIFPAIRLRRGWTVACLVGMLSLVGQVWSASVEPGTGYTNAFDAQPQAADWATYSAAGSASDNYDADEDINANITASLVVSPIVSDPGDPPEKNGEAMWSSSGLYLLTRPTGNQYTVLMGKFVNNTKTNATQFTIAYQLTFAGDGVAEDSGHGTRVYYSRTGEAGSWINVPSLNTTESADGTTPVSASVNVDWPDEASLYVVWMDDNASGMGDDVANEIDNFSLQVTGGHASGFCVFTGRAGAGGVLRDGHARSQDRRARRERHCAIYR